MRRTILISSLAVALLALSAMARQIQIGTVTDPVGARLPGARVTLSNALNGCHEARTTDERGEFTFNSAGAIKGELAARLAE